MRAFGCDIGNAYSYISLLTNANEDPLSMLPAKSGYAERGIPSEAYLVPGEDGVIEVAPERKRARRNAARIIRAIKTKFGDDYIDVEGVNVETADVYAAIAERLISLGNRQLEEMGAEPVYDLVVTYPVAFAGDMPRLNKIKNSIESVVVNEHKLHVVGRIPEPAAVAIDYLYYTRQIMNKDNSHLGKSTVIVYDLGHGTFDVAAVTVEGTKVPKLLDQDSHPNIGGKNFDEELYKEFLGLLSSNYNYVPANENEKENIRQAAVEAKEYLSNDDVWEGTITGSEQTYQITLNRERFETLIENYIFETMEITSRVIENVRKKGRIDAIVMSGGSCEIPMVRRCLEELVTEYGNISVFKHRPCRAVSYGAARYADGIDLILPPPPIPDSISTPVVQPTETSDGQSTPTPVPFITSKGQNPVLQQFAEFSYGILDDKDFAGRVLVKIKGSQPLPASSDEFSLLSIDGRPTVCLYRSLEKGDFDFVTDITRNAFSIMRIPFSVPANTTARVTITLLEDQSITVTCKLPNGKTITKSTSNSVELLVK